MTWQQGSEASGSTSVSEGKVKAFVVTAASCPRVTECSRDGTSSSTMPERRSAPKFGSSSSKLASGTHCILRKTGSQRLDAGMRLEVWLPRISQKHRPAQAVNGVRRCEQNISGSCGSGQSAMNVSGTTTPDVSDALLPVDNLLFCQHHDNDFYHHTSELRSLPWDDNVVSSQEAFQSMLQSLDSCLFLEDKAAWKICQVQMRASWTSMTFTYMSTSGKWKGYGAFCRYCRRFVLLECHSKRDTPGDREKQRSYWLHFWGIERRAENARPVV